MSTFSQTAIRDTSLRRVLKQLVSSALAQTTVDPVSMAPQGSVTCYACGQTGVDPHADIAGSFCDVTIDTNTCPAMSKIYNFTCDIMDKMDRSRLAHWERSLACC